MNPVELTREDVERILALAIQIRERAMECDRVRFEMRHNTVFVLREAIRDVSNFAIERCEAALRGMESQGGFEIRCNDNGTLDEIVGSGTVHLEQMNTDHWWLGFGDGPLLHVNLHARGKIKANVLDERSPSSVERARAQPRGENSKS